MNIAIVGAGLAGAACAYIFKNAGFHVTIYEQANHVAPGASGNPIGLVSPKIFAEYNTKSTYYIHAFLEAVDLFKKLPDIDWQQCGAFFLCNTEQKQKRFAKFLNNHDFQDLHAKWLVQEQQENIIGIKTPSAGMYFNNAGFLSPKKLCEFYTQGVEIKFGCNIDCIKKLSQNTVIVANGLGYGQYPELANLPLSVLKGQITFAETPNLKNLKTNLHYGGYCTPAYLGKHTLGAAYNRNHLSCEPEKRFDTENIQKLETAIESPLNFLNTENRASFRLKSRDYFPVVGKVYHESKSLFVSLAHGSHGIMSSLKAAKILLELIKGTKNNHNNHILKVLSPQRFI